MRLTALLIACLLTACTGGQPGFDTTNAVIRTYSPAGATTQATTMIGDVATKENNPNLTVACVTPLRTVAAVKVTNNAYSLALPAQDKYESDKILAVHAIWQVVLFNDKNNDGIYDNPGAPGRANERDTSIATMESYRLAYKGYVSTLQSFLFLPHNDFQRGWIVVQRTGSQPSQYHQNFARKFSLTTSDYFENGRFGN
jgi:hypothetical protein